jgi:hypothetical protein
MLVKPDGPEKWRGKLQEVRAQIEQLDSIHRPKARKFGIAENVGYEDCPMPSKEIHIIVAGYWQRDRG